MESWTTPCYILSAGFADIFPPDEDPMPLDGNPHPMPGQLQPNGNMFVLPQYPKLGWNMPQNQQQQQPENNDQHMEHEAQNQEQPNMMQESGSSGIAQSDGSVQGAPAANLIINQVLLNDMVMPMEHQQAMLSRVVYGPIEPPSFRWEKSAQVIIPAVLAANIPRSITLPAPLFMMLAKRSWNIAFDLPTAFTVHQQDTQPKTCLIAPVRRRKVARSLVFYHVPDGNEQAMQPTFSDTPAPIRRKKGKKIVTADEDLSVRRSTRQSAKAQGFRHSALSYTPAKKKPRRSRKAEAEAVEERQEEEEPQQSTDAPTTPHTPVRILQQVGRNLQIPEVELSQDRLEAGPEEEMEKKGDNE